MKRHDEELGEEIIEQVKREAECELKRIREKFEARGQDYDEEVLKWEAKPFYERWPVPRGKGHEELRSKLLPIRALILVVELKRLRRKYPDRPVVKNNRDSYYPTFAETLAEMLAEETGLSESTIRKAWRRRH